MISNEEMLYMPHPVSRKHPQMSRYDRAAQFSPFAALTGHDAAVREAARVTEEKVELDESEKEQMNQILAELLEKYQGHPPVSLMCFCPDQHKSGGEYRTIKGKIKKIDHTRQKIYLEDQESIGLEQIVKIEEQTETDFI